MRRRVSWIEMSPGGSRHEHINAIGDLSWRLTKSQAIASIDSGSDEFYVLDAKNPRICSTVGVVTPKDGAPYLRTHRDGVWDDNLLALPRR